MSNNSSLSNAAASGGGRGNGPPQSGGPPPGRGSLPRMQMGGRGNNFQGRGYQGRSLPPNQPSPQMGGYPGPIPPHMPPQQFGHPGPQYQMHPQQGMMMTAPGAPMMYRGPPPQQAGPRAPYGMPMQPPPQYYPMNAGPNNAPPPPMGMNRSAPPSSLGAAVAAGGAPGQPQQSNRPAPTPRVKKSLVITDKDGNVVDLSGGKGGSSAPSSGKATPTEGDNKKDGDNKDVGVDGATAQMSSLQLASAKKAEDAGNAMKQAALEAIKAGSAKKARLEAEKKAKEEADLKAKEEAERKAEEEAERLAKEKAEREERERLAEAEARARKEAEERARKEFEERQRKEAEEKAARIKAEEELRAKLQAAASAAPPAAKPATTPQKDSDTTTTATSSAATTDTTTTTAPKPNISPSPSSGGFRPGGFRPGGARAAGLRPGGASSAAGGDTSPTKSNAENVNANANGDSARKPIIYSKQMLLSLRDEEYCVCRPDDLVDLTVRSGEQAGRRQSSSRGNYGGDNRRGDGRQGGGGDEWSRGREMPRPPPQQYNTVPGRGGGGGGGGRGGGGSEWNRGQAPPPGRGRGGGGQRRQSSRGNNEPFPDDDFAPLVTTANQWRPSKDNSAIATVEKQVKSLLNKMTKEKFDKLSLQMCDIPILSYEMLTLVIKLVYEKAISEPSFSDMYANLCHRLAATVKKSTFIKIIESDEDPLAEPGAEVDYSEGGSGSVSFRWSNNVSTTDAEIVGPFETDQECIDIAVADEETERIDRGDMEISLHRLLIQRGMFIKIMQSKADGKYYTVFFPVSKADECGQQLSLEIFTSEIEAQSHAVKMNTFKRSLLNKCEDEFNKQDIYTDWKVEKKAYEKQKSSMSEKEQKEKKEELEFRRMTIKKQMLGNIKFIGEVYLLSMLKEKIMRFCIHSLLKIEEYDGGLRSQTGEDGEMDEEDHEALCNLFKTIGKTIDNPKSQPYMKIYFDKIDKLSKDLTQAPRTRFMYADLIEMRSKGWKLRRKVETAKTLEEIRKDAERDERAAAAASQQHGGRGGGRGGRGGGRGDHRGGRGSSSYDRAPSGRGGYRDHDNNRGYDNRSGGRGHDNRGSRAPPVAGGILPPRGPSAPVFTEEKLKIRANSMRQEWMESRDKKELEISIDETSASPNASKIIVQTNIDYAADCKEAELKAIIEMIEHLFRAGKVSKSDIVSAMADLVEFIDSFACDNPHIYAYVGEMFCTFANMQALTVAWLADCTSKVMEESCKPKVIEGAMMAIQKAYGPAAVRSCFGDKDERAALERLLGSAKLKELEAQFV